MNITETLKNLRKEHNLTQGQLAERLNIGQATIAGYESGSREPKINILMAYADYFECSVDYLIGREDDFGNILIPPSKEKSAPILNQDGKELIEIFNQLEHGYQVQILEYARFIAERRGITTNFKKKNNN